MPRKVDPGIRVHREERLEVVRRLLLAGGSVQAIARKLEQGVRLGDGRLLKVRAATTHADVRALGAEWRQLLDNPAVLEAYVGTSLDALRTIADRALNATRQIEVRGPNGESKLVEVPAPNYHAAIRAHQAIVGIVGRVSARWRSRDDARGGSEEEEEREVSELSDAELEERIRTKRAHLVLIGADVIDGEEGTADDAAGTG